jgi:acetylornithine deacetylase/succinyl-diaminopimelate desuccinylase-like protein
MISTRKLLAELVAIPSVNPAFVSDSNTPGGEKGMADFLAATAAQSGLEVEFQPVLPGRPNLLARLVPSGKPVARVLLAPHMDTVNAEAAAFLPRIRHDRLFGRGACDTKGSVAAMLSALAGVAQSGRRPEQTEIPFAGFVDEEHGQAGSRAFANARTPVDLAIIGEPTCLKVITAHKGSLWLGLETRGRSAHGSQPELGQNAVHEMSRVVHVLETKYAAQLRRRRHPLLGTATVNVGVICGGTQANIVPDHCSILVDRRTLPGEKTRGVIREIAALLKEAKLKAVISNLKMEDCPPLESSPQIPLIAQLLRTIGQRRPAGVNYFCDAAVLAQKGIPSVAFGPGDIAQAHTADEWISLGSLDRARDLLVRFLRSLP